MRVIPRSRVKNVSAYQDLKQHFYTIGTLAEIDALLSWDMEAMMPVGGQEARAEQMALMDTHIHSLTRDARVGDWLQRAAEESLGSQDRANLQLMQRRWIHANAVSDELVTAFSKARSKCSMVWRASRKENDFARVEPYLSDLMELVREQAEARADALDCEPYDALLDQYDPDATEESISELFDEIADFLPSLTEEIIEVQGHQEPPLPLNERIETSLQKEAAQRVMKLLGFDFERGRLDESIHPFCGGIPDDVRITTNYDESDVFFGLLGVIHETGHALYEQGLPIRWRRLPCGGARSMTLHESQSLLYEMQLACSAPFLRSLTPILHESFAVDGPEWSAENLHTLATRVKPGLIRIRADEVTYPAHIVLRFRLERALMSGDLRVRDLPEAWREGMRELLGVVPDTDTDGVMQDIHWYEGLVGYFPTYTLGALGAAQLFEAASADATVKEGLEAGDYMPLNRWLKSHVYQHGAMLNGVSMIKEATGKKLGVDAFRRHVERRYLGAP